MFHGMDPNFNPRLRTAITAAKQANLPKDKIDNAIKKATSADNDVNYDEIRYEGYGPGGVAIIVETLTDNKNRTASEVRAAFSKNGGALGEPALQIPKGLFTFVFFAIFSSRLGIA